MGIPAPRPCLARAPTHAQRRMVGQATEHCCTPHLPKASLRSRTTCPEQEADDQGGSGCGCPALLAHRGVLATSE